MLKPKCIRCSMCQSPDVLPLVGSFDGEFFQTAKDFISQIDLLSQG